MVNGTSAICYLTYNRVQITSLLDLRDKATGTILLLQYFAIEKHKI